MLELFNVPGASARTNKKWAAAHNKDPITLSRRPSRLARDAAEGGQPNPDRAPPASLRLGIEDGAASTDETARGFSRGPRGEPVRRDISHHDETLTRGP